MNKVATLKASAEKGGPVVLGAGVAMLVVSLVYPSGHSANSASGRPAPTVTVTSTARAPAPSSSTRLSATRTVEATRRTVAQHPDRTAGAGQARADGQQDGAPAHPRPSPSPAPPTPAEPASCSGQVVSVRLPLGVLPCNAITIGGNR